MTSKEYQGNERGQKPGCHNKAYWGIKELNYDFKLAGEKRLFDISSLDEWRTQAYENAKLFQTPKRNMYVVR